MSDRVLTALVYNPCLQSDLSIERLTGEHRARISVVLAPHTAGEEHCCFVRCQLLLDVPRGYPHRPVRVALGTSRGGGTARASIITNIMVPHSQDSCSIVYLKHHRSSEIGICFGLHTTSTPIVSRGTLMDVSWQPLSLQGLGDSKSASFISQLAAVAGSLLGQPALCALIQVPGSLQRLESRVFGRVVFLNWP